LTQLGDKFLLDAGINALGHVLSWPTIGVMFAGMAIGSLIAFLPGIGNTAGLVILLPFAIALVDDPLTGIALILGAHAVMNTADSVLAILFGIPGGSSAQALIMDGYPMTQQGQAGKALGASFTASGVGGVIGAFALLLAIPLVIPLVRIFGSPELFVLALWGISMVGMLSGKSLAKGVAMGALGLLLGTVGLDPQRAIPRYTLGIPYLWDGIPLIAVSLGLFAAPQAIELIQRRTLLNVSQTDLRIDFAATIEGVKATFRHWALVIRSSMMGVFLGIIPGVGGSVIDWLVYGQTVQFSRNRENFGKGDIRGVIAPDSATNSKEGGQLIPTLAFGVPGGVGMAILLAGFLALGITPGMQILTAQLDLLLSMVWIIAIANIVTTLALLFVSPYLARVTALKAPILVTIIFTFSLLGSYMAQRDFMDLVVFGVFSAIGYVMKEAGWARAPMLLGFVLSAILERYLFISMRTFGHQWIFRPGVLVLLIVVVVSYLLVLRSQSRRSESGATMDGDSQQADVGDLPIWRWILGLVFNVFIVGLAIWAIYASLGWRYEVRMFPLFVAGCLLILAGIELIKKEIPRLFARHKPERISKSSINMESRANQAQAGIPWKGPVWFLTGVMVVLLLGLLVGLPLFLLILVRYGLDERWRMALTMMGVTAGIFLLFHQVFNIVWPRPLLLDWFLGT
jgi:putative tricarboxylic transport membrane protein